jgi:hypothetical protein
MRSNILNKNINLNNAYIIDVFQCGMIIEILVMHNSTEVKNG